MVVRRNKVACIGGIRRGQELAPRTEGRVRFAMIEYNVKQL
jgi:hypothetical protein